MTAARGRGLLVLDAAVLADLRQLNILRGRMLVPVEGTPKMAVVGGRTHKVRRSTPGSLDVHGNPGELGAVLEAGRAYGCHKLYQTI